MEPGPKSDTEGESGEGRDDFMLRKSSLYVEGFGEIRELPGTLFLEVLDRHGIDLHNDCGGHLKCGKCRIIFQTADALE